MGSPLTLPRSREHFAQKDAHLFKIGILQPRSPIFVDAEKARAWLEAELWPMGPVCPRCRAIQRATRMRGKSHRRGLHQCNRCRKPFTVTLGTIFEGSKIPLNKWFAAVYIIMTSKKIVTATEIGRTLEVSYKTAWSMRERIRTALRNIDPVYLRVQKQRQGALLSIAGWGFPASYDASVSADSRSAPIVRARLQQSSIRGYSAPILRQGYKFSR